MTTARKYDTDAAAEELGVSPRWLREHLDELPHIKFGDNRNARVWFMQDHIDQIRLIFTRRPAAPIPTPEVAPLAAVPGDLRPVPARGRRAAVSFPATK